MDRDSVSLQRAVELHLAEHGFPPDGGIGERWVVVGLGPVPICFPNTRARRLATPIHDLNHVLSGYGHDALGEAEIGAWELGGGCERYWAAWVLNWSALLPGVVRAPKRLLRAFARGRRTGNLYGARLEKVRQRPVTELRHELGLDEDHRVRTRDAVLFTGVVCLAPVVALIPGVAALVTSPLWLAAGAHRRHRSAATP
ncbi:MAG TPA: hypothetical protein DCQ30_04470 [Acidimicrobiaceae bacterium]|nr:hypothetical protein [Acidimicrobiaceae bacterium]